MKIAIVSDTHYAVERFRHLLQLLKFHRVHHLIHAGDYDGVGVEDVICAERSINFYIALGNCDCNWQKNDLLKSKEHIIIGEVISFAIENVSFGVAHIPGKAQEALKDRDIRIFVSGHTHKKQMDKHSHGWTLNPGSLVDNGSYLLLDLSSLKVTDHYIES